MRLNRHQRRARIFVRALLVMVAASALPAGAQEPRIEFTVRPTRFDTSDPRTAAWLIHEAEPGETLRDEVEVENLGTVPIDLVVYPADAVTTSGGEFTLEAREAADDGVAAWVSVRRTSLSLVPGEAARVPVTIRVPDDATPGDHPGGVVARTARPTGGGGLRTLLAVGARLYLTVPGELVEDLRVRDLRAEVLGGRATFHLDLENGGNTLLDVAAGYDVSGPFGLGGSRRELPLIATLVPGAEAAVAVPHPEVLLGGPHSVRFDLTYGSGGVAEIATRFFVVPPWLVWLALALILAVAVGQGLRARRDRRRRAAAP